MKAKKLSVRYAKRRVDTCEPTYVEEDYDLDIGHTAFLMVDVMGLLSPIMRDHLLPALNTARRAGMPIVYAANAAPRLALDRYEFTNQRYRSNGDDFPVFAASTCSFMNPNSSSFHLYP